MRAPRGPRGRPGFTLIEILVVLAVLAVLAAVVGRNVASTTQSGRSAALAESLDALRGSIYAYRGDVRRYPTHLSQLSTKPTSASDLCVPARSVPAAFLDNWRGPYTAREITASGIPVGDARILDALDTPGVHGIETTGTLFIVVEDVDEAIAARLERVYDGETPDYGAGVIRWEDAPPTGNGVGTLRFGIAISGC